jgi:hypothetical protein
MYPPSARVSIPGPRSEAEFLRGLEGALNIQWEPPDPVIVVRVLMVP